MAYNTYQKLNQIILLKKRTGNRNIIKKCNTLKISHDIILQGESTFKIISIK